MCNLKRLFFIVFLSVCFSFRAFSINGADSLSIQKDSIDIAQKIEQLAKGVEALNKTIDITVSNISIQEFVRSVANLSGLNINVSPELNFIVVNNFTKVRVADLLIFICKQYNIEISVIGNIVDLYKTPKSPKPLRGIVEYNKSQDELNLDFQNIPLAIVTRQIVSETGKNVFAEPDIQNKIINVYLQKQPFISAIENLTKANNLELEKNEDGSFFIKDLLKPQVQNLQTSNDSYNRQSYQSGTSSRRNATDVNGDKYDLNITKTGPKTFSITAVNAPLFDVIKEVSKQCSINYFITGNVESSQVPKTQSQNYSQQTSSVNSSQSSNATVTMTLSNIEYEDFIKGLLIGRELTYIKDNNIYIIGDRNLNKFKTSRVIKFENRPVDSLIVKLPKEVKGDLEIKEFSDLNSIIVSGSQERIKLFEDFCRQIDKSVPVIMIEVIIVDVNKTITTAIGIDAGLGTPPDKSVGQVFPGVDIKLSTSGINSLIQKFNGLGLANLGNVSKDFYLNIRALESNGTLKIRSTPILSTLNGNNAKISIGSTEYYLESNSNITAGQTSVVTENKVYKSLEAKLEILIKPFVSGDESITLDVSVSQSNFTPRIGDQKLLAPPGKVSRDFKSKIRVQNQDMVLLGGLEEISNKETSSGVPILQRIPIIKWLFSSRSKEKKDTKLNIFIRPTIIG